MPQQRKNTNRIDKVNSHIQRELGPILHEFTHGQKGLVTITKVDTSKDMKWAKVWISIFYTDDSKADELDSKNLDFLQKNIFDIQGELNKHFSTKIIPRISFHLDIGSRHAAHIAELIRKAHEEQES